MYFELYSMLGPRRQNCRLHCSAIVWYFFKSRYMLKQNRFYISQRNRTTNRPTNEPHNQTTLWGPLGGLRSLFGLTYTHGLFTYTRLTAQRERFGNTLFCCSAFHPVLTEFIMSNKPVHEAHSLSGVFTCVVWPPIKVTVACTFADLTTPHYKRTLWTTPLQRQWVNLHVFTPLSIMEVHQRSQREWNLFATILVIQ